MPIHLDGLDITSNIERSDSALIVACNMCAGASIAMIENKPFLQLFRSFLTSPPLKIYIRTLQNKLCEKGVQTKWFRGGLIQQFFLCLWTQKQRNKLHECAKDFDVIIVLGCDSAIETARDTVRGTGCTVVKGMKVGGIMNTKPKFRLPGNILFENNDIVSCCDRHCKKSIQKAKNEEKANIASEAIPVSG